MSPWLAWHRKGHNGPCIAFRSTNSFSKICRTCRSGYQKVSNVWIVITSPMPTDLFLRAASLKWKAMLALRLEKEIQLQVVMSRGDAVMRNTSSEGVPVIHNQLQQLRQAWDTLMFSGIQCKSQLESCQSQWESYQENVTQFNSWLKEMHNSLASQEHSCPELADKLGTLARAKASKARSPGIEIFTTILI
uniref:Uncharacterized protein n=1 Tax=Eptatretus burgeri TaxID=7764 RepID=A0A8C4NMC0_EPTBU